MRYLLLTTTLMLLAPVATGQDQGSKPKPAKPAVEQQKPPEKGEKETAKPAKQDPKTGKDGGSGNQDPKKPDPKKQGEKPADPKKADQPKITETKVDSGLDDVSGDDLPKGMDPADLAAMKSAQAMIAAEKRLQEMLKAGKFKDIEKILTFEEISSWPYEDGLIGMPKGIKKLHGKKLMMTGFMLPIDEVEDIKEFLLVQSLWACCYGQPPDINGIVRVVMKGKSRIDYQFEPIKIVGDFSVEAYLEDGYCLDIYQLHADSVEVIK